jgi:hypothetical protein
MTEIFAGPDREILMAFLSSEAKSYPQKFVDAGLLDSADYSTYQLNDRGREYIKGILEKVENEIKEMKFRGEIKKGFNYAIFQSLTNLGLLNRSVKLSPSSDFWEFSEGDIFIVICPCGNLNHWGNIHKTIHATDEE